MAGVVTSQDGQGVWALSENDYLLNEYLNIFFLVLTLNWILKNVINEQGI